MRRDYSKPNYPGYLEATSGGSALKGEDKWQCVKRELQEETGIACEHFEEISTHTFVEDHCIFHNFLCTVDCPKDSVQLQQGETLDYAWLSEDEFIKFVRSDEMIPRQKLRYHKFLRSMGYIK